MPRRRRHNFTAFIEQLVASSMDVSGRVARDGYAFIGRFEASKPTEEALRLIGEAIALGEGTAVHQLTPQDAELAPPNSYSGIFGFNAFPLHTDLAHWHRPPRYFALRCVQGDDAVATRIVDGAPIVDRIGEAVLSRSLVQPRRARKGQRPLLSLYRRDARGHSLLRWDEVFIQPASPRGVLGFDLLREQLAAIDPIEILLSHPGDTLIVDNWRMLHGRSAVPDRGAVRTIDRAYLEELK